MLGILSTLLNKHKTQEYDMIICDGTNIKFEPVYPWLKLKSKLKEQRADQAACL